VMTRLILLIAVVFLAYSAKAGTCPSGWGSYDGYCYKLFTQSLSYTDARQYCRNQGGYLTSITTWQANSWINSFIPKTCSEFWIGGSRSSNNAAFKWDDSRTFSYSNFDNKFPKWGSNYISYIHGSTFGAIGKWRSLTNAYKKPFLCKKSPSSTTKAPTTTVPNCWTCPNGYKHWFQAGYASAPNGDACACVQVSSPVSAPRPGSSPVASPPSSSNGPYAKYTGKMRIFLDAMSIGSYDTGSVSFSPSVAPYSPWNPPPTALITDLLNILHTTTKYKTLMMYYIDQWTVPLIANAGFKMLGILALNAGADNSAMINAGIAMAKAYPDTIVGIACGNELGLTNGITWSTIYTVSQCVTALKSAGVSQPVGVIDTYDSLCGRGGSCAPWSDLAGLPIDWIGANIYPYWDNVWSGSSPCTYANTAAAKTMADHKNLMSIYNVPVIVTEWGWPGAPPGQTFLSQANVATGQQCGVCNDDSQKVMVQNMINLYRNTGLPCNTFEAFREAWKGSSSLSPEVNWGICLGTYPYTCVSAPN